ncbi:amidohydrolase family protein [Nitratireductor sp. GZWM139]|uniref:amidohydrolase family protein n=1 Tax=Nitratireductor sp. GZWM139 TaxID=2950541 RepID=UPI0024BD7AFB|nr:amidohydrolase family protein [Nitratireductor sp. GZWM139]MDJ1466121.1 amidohydrolase family protein [Nitratireductor sp. GZWM139]
MSSQKPTVVEGGTVIAFDGTKHRIIEKGHVAFVGDEIVSVGRTFAGDAGTIIDANGKLVIPGLINLHSHAGVDIGSRAIVDAGRRDLWRSGFLNFEGRTGPQGLSFGRKANARAGLRYGLASILQNGTTTAVELGGADGSDEGEMVRFARECGIRLYYGPTFYSGYYHFDERGGFYLKPDEDHADRGFQAALDFIDEHHGANDDLFRTMIIPSSFLRTSRDLFGRIKQAAADREIGITLHIAESIWEFHNVVNRFGKSPIELAHDWGLLGPEVILGHTVYVGGHSQTSWPYKGDLEAIAETGATVAHAPVTFARRGMALESFQRYQDHGINIGIGTDTYPLDILEEMRMASIIGKTTDRNFESAHARSVFDAATLGGARALRRDDLGRLAPGAKADIVLIDLDNLRMAPFSDPIRALIYCANGEQVEKVFVAGKLVVDGGRTLAWPQEELLADAWDSANAVLSSFAEYDLEGRALDEVYPPCYQAWDD